MEPTELFPSNLNLSFLEELYEAFQRDPGSVEAEWRDFFEALQNGELPAPSSSPTSDVVGVADRAAETGEPSSGTDRSAGHKAKVAQIRRLALFSTVPEEGLNEVARIADEVKFADGDYLCHEGERGDELFVITSGAVHIRRAGRLYTELGAGEVVGELSVLDRRPRSGDVLAVGSVRALRIHADDFQPLLERRCGLALGLLQVMVGRVRERSHLQARVDQLVRLYRVRGHVAADLDPLGRRRRHHRELELDYYGLTEKDLDKPFVTNVGGEEAVRNLSDIVDRLQRISCGAIGVQYMHIDDIEVQRWLRDRVEDEQTHRPLQRDEQIRILRKLTDAEVFETFLHRKYIGAKRFSLEGAESLIPLLDMAIEEAGRLGVRELVIGMAHRGRLNVLANILEKPAREIFREFEDADPEIHLGQGDVKYHLGYSSDRTTASGQQVHLSLCFNPSHLEYVGPVVLGRTRAKQDRRGGGERRRGVPIIIHGDASMAGEGIVQELFNLSELPGYTTGGAVHIVVNNQIGFTTTPDEGRSSPYATDVARMLQIPVFHVNGEHPDAVARVIQLAMDFRMAFKKDVVIDMYCYRRHGHNEGDDPTFTQPLDYKIIKKRPSVRASYVENLLKLGEVTREEAKQIAQRSRERLEEHLAEARQKEYPYRPEPAGAGLWRPYAGGSEADVPEVPTTVPYPMLIELMTALIRLPDGLHVGSKIERFLGNRKDMIHGERPLDWGAAEALALASLAMEGFRVRLTGQDTVRGTFSHRHAMLFDEETGEGYMPLAHLGEGQAPIDIINSPLTEAGVLGYEYGYSLDYPDGLVAWEAQFGDFCNSAQVIIDQFIASSEDKWRRLSGLVMLLPHGFEGQGPEHSSARLERFLVLAAEENLQVVYPSTPAQLFHCLRRQIIRPWRKPLVVMTPKSLLRHPACVSSLDDLAEGGFSRVLPDDGDVDPHRVRRILLCSGKVYYDLNQTRRDRGIEDVAILRLEQLYPFSRAAIREALRIYPEATPVVWVQEEPANMGAWFFLKLRLGDAVEGQGQHPFTGVSRPESASPATGSAAAHRIEQEGLIDRAFAS